MSAVGAEVTFASALAGHWARLAAIGVGGLGVGELFARHLAIAIPCLLLALAIEGRRWRR